MMPERYCSSGIESYECNARHVMQSFISRSKCCFLLHQCNFRFSDGRSGPCPLTLSLIMNDWWDKACIGSVRRILLYNMIYWCPWWHQWRTSTNVTGFLCTQKSPNSAGFLHKLPLPPYILSFVNGKQIDAVSQINGHNLIVILPGCCLSPWY